MSEFKAITTQEEFEMRLKERLEQKERNVLKKFEGYTSPEDLETIKSDYQSKIDTLNQSISDKDSQYSSEIEGYIQKIADYETDSVKTRVAIDMGIPLKLKGRLKGTTEDEIRADAELLSGLYSPAPPLASSEHTMTAEDEKKLKLENGYKEMAKKLGGY